MNVFRELRRRQQFGRVIRVAVVGIGAMGRGIAAQLKSMPGVAPAILVNRTLERAIEAWVQLGFAREEVVVSEDVRSLEAAVAMGKPAVSRCPYVAAAVDGIEVVVEATGTLEPAARLVLAAIHHCKHVVVMNAELDATLGCYLCERARQQGVVYSYADGDQPGVLMRLLEWVDGLGFEVVAAVNCKGYMDVYATPESSLEWSRRMKTSPKMVCAFTDGTKMNLENAVVANASGLVPEIRGMNGVKTSQKEALKDFSKVLKRVGVVDYTLGGDFGGGVFVIGRCTDWGRVGHYLDYLKMGSGPDYLFLRPYHLCSLEAPLSVVEAVLDREPTIAPRGAPVAEVVAIAKRDLMPGDLLDGIGGNAVYGQIDTVERSVDFLPIGLADGVRVNTPVYKGDAVPRECVDLDGGDYINNLRNLQDMLFASVAPSRRYALQPFC
ncbi:MAG: NAD(P)-dependent oxidoreductase [Verrucomicrobiota bacterium]